MFEKLEKLEEKYILTDQHMQQAEVYSDPVAYGKLAREQKELTPVVEAYREYKKCLSHIDGLKEMLADAEMREIAQAELEEKKNTLASLEEKIKILLLPKDENDGRSVVMEIRGGVGGEESALFARDLFRMYSMYAEKRGWQAEIANINETELGGIKEVSFVIEGEGAYSRLKYESGVHCVKRVPETEANGRIQTSTATVAVLPEMGEVDFAVDPKDLKIDTFRSTGAGGQKVNKTESAIRITHLPTGTVVECQDERSQYKNKDRAMKILLSRLYRAEKEKQDAAIAAQRKNQVGWGERSEKIRTYFFLRSQVVDHRLTGDKRSFNIDSVINGDLDELIDTLTVADQAEKMRLAGGEE